MKVVEHLKKTVAILLCLVMVFSAAPELWCMGVNAVAETIGEAVEEANQVSEKSNLAAEIPDGVEDATISDNLTLTEDTAYRNLKITNGTVDLNGFTLTVYADVFQTGGTITLNGGTMIVYGDYRMESNSTVSGILKMQNEEDYLLVYGDFYAKTSVGLSGPYSGDTYYLTNGTIEFKGNVEQVGSSSYVYYYAFYSTGQHKVILSGEGAQTVSFENGYSRFNILDIKNDDVIFDTFVDAGTLVSDASIVSAQGLTIDLDSHMLRIKESLQHTKGTIDINGGMFTVGADVLQTNGTIELNGGTMVVHGNYRIESNSTVGGILKMQNEEDYLLVHGDFYAKTPTGVSGSGYGGTIGEYYLTHGTIEFKGNVEQVESNGYNYAFYSTEQHKVILSGEGTQTVSFENWSSQFNTLFLTKDISSYTFENVRYNSLQYIADTEDIIDSIFSNLVTFDKETQCAFHVYSRYDAVSGINGANVTFNGVTKKTDRNGLVVFDKPEGETASITVSKSGYHDYTSVSYQLNGDTGCNYISMVPINVKSYIVSATCDGYDVLTATARLDCSRHEPVYITVEAKSEYPISEYALMQGDTVIASNLTGVFVLNTSDFKAKTQVAVRIRNTAGTVATYGININVYDSKAENDSWPIVNSVSIGGNLTVTIDNDVPVVGGMTVKVGSSTCPVSVSTTKDKIKIGINVPVDEATVYTQETILNYLTHTEGDKTTEKVKTSFAGYMECIFDEDGNMVKTKGIAYMTVGYTGNYDFTTVIGVVPVTLGVSVSASGGVVIDMIGYDFENSQFLFPDVGWTASGAITAKVGVGVKYLSAGIYGNLTNNWIGSIFPDFEFEKWTISGELGVYGKIAIFEGKWPLLKTGVLQVYPYDSAVDPAAMVMSADCLYSAEEYALISYATRLSESLESYAIENGWVLDADAYSYAEPAIVTAGDTTVMVYLDHDATRSDANAQVLVYRIYDNETATWSEAIPVDANQTADSEFSVYSDGNAIYLIYTEAREQLADDIDIYSFPKEIEVAFTTFDAVSGAFGTPIRLTQNSVFETLPSIGVVDNIITVTWIENAENDIFCANNANAIVMSRYIDGIWTATSLATGLPTVTDIAVGETGEQGVVSYIVDTDCDLTTQEDKQVLILDIETTEIITCAESGFYSELSFSTIQGKPCVMWCADNNLYYTILNQGTVTTNDLLDESVEGLDNYRICTGENGKAMILFLRNGENRRTLWGISGNYNSNVWGAPMELTDNENYINAFAAFFDNGVLSVAYTDATVTTSVDSFETVSMLIFEQLESKDDVEIIDIQVDHAGIVPGANVSINVTVQNNGFEPVTSFVLTLTNAEGTVIATKQIQTTIESGAIAGVDFAFATPKVSSEQYTMAVSLETGTDVNADNDIITFDLWCCDLSVVAKQIIIGTDNYISANVVNGGYLSSNGTLQLIDSTGNVIASKPIKLLEYGEAEEILIDLNEESLAIVDSGLYTVRVLSTESDFSEGNNDASIYLVNIAVGNGLEILCDHSYGDWITEVTPSPASTGLKYKVCAICGDKVTEVITQVTQLKFAGASLSLQHNLAINYKVDKALFESVGYTDPYVVFELNGVKTKVFNYTVSGDRYIFAFRNIAPNQMNDTIKATLCATYNGEVYSSATREYSVAEYCYSMLDLYAADQYAELRTLLVDLLNYGAASQTYTGYRTDALVNASLTAAQLQWGTSEEPDLDTVLDTTYKTVENPTAKWKGAGLHLQESVSMRLKFTADSIEGLTVKIESGTNTWTISSDKFLEEDGVYYVYFTGLDAGQMRQSVYLTIYDGSTPVSNTVCYSIESYAYEKQNSTIAGLPELVKAMMKYGDSAYAYVH